MNLSKINFDNGFLRILKVFTVLVCLCYLGLNVFMISNNIFLFFENKVAQFEEFFMIFILALVYIAVPWLLYFIIKRVFIPVVKYVISGFLEKK